MNETKSNKEYEKSEESDSIREEENSSSRGDQEELVRLKHKIVELESMLNEKDSELLVKLAELDNSKKRLEREFQNFKSFANEQIIIAFLEVLDNLERAFSLVREQNSLTQGVAMTINQFKEIFKREGLEEIGLDSFDPRFHHAIDYVLGEEDGQILEEVRKGYILKGKVIRPSLVKVSKKEEQYE